MAGADSVVRLGDESLWYWWWLEASSERSALRIGIALSGGGVRATVFHLGVLARLARQDLLSHVTAISSVSGGSLAAGLVFAAGGNRWPDSGGYLNQVVPHLLRLLTERNIQSDYVRQSLMLPWRLIGPLVVRSSRYRWSQWERQQWQSVRPQYARLHLWDGGVYDNLGIEPLYKPSRGSSAPAVGRQRWTLTTEEVDRVANLPTTLRRLSCQEFSLLFRHGFEVADQTLTRHMGDYFAAPERRIIPFRVA